MAGTETKRIIELTEASTVQSGDFIAVDSNARGTKKVSTDTLATSAALTAETNARAGADEQMSERMDGIEEQTALIQNPTKTLSGALVSFSDGANMPMVACRAEIVPQQSGTGTPSPDNVRQISGWESVVLTDAGKNLLPNKKAQVGSAQVIVGDDTASITGAQGFYLPVGTYTLLINATKTCSVYWIDKATGDNSRVGATNTPIRINVTASGYYLALLYDGGGIAVSEVNEAQLELGTTATTYEPYTGTTTSVNLGRTVYGGTLDVVSGVLTAYPFYPSYNGETLNGRWICDRAVYAEGTTPPTGSQVALISGTGTTYQLTPTEVSTLLGENNVWADSGDVEITYRRDISIVLENLENALNGSNSLNAMMMSAPTENTAEEPTEDEAEDDMR